MELRLTKFFGKLFLTNKFDFNHQDITMFDGKRIMTIKLYEFLNNHYINIVQKLSGEKSVCCTLKLSQMLNF